MTGWGGFWVGLGLVWLALALQSVGANLHNAIVFAAKKIREGKP